MTSSSPLSSSKLIPRSSILTLTVATDCFVYCYLFAPFLSTLIESLFFESLVSKVIVFSLPHQSRWTWSSGHPKMPVWVLHSISIFHHSLWVSHLAHAVVNRHSHFVQRVTESFDSVLYSLDLVVTDALELVQHSVEGSVLGDDLLAWQLWLLALIVLHLWCGMDVTCEITQALMDADLCVTYSSYPHLFNTAFNSQKAVYESLSQCT
jgi:hypothetical protein